MTQSRRIIRAVGLLARNNGAIFQEFVFLNNYYKNN